MLYFLRAVVATFAIVDGGTTPSIPPSLGLNPTPSVPGDRLLVGGGRQDVRRKHRPAMKGMAMKKRPTKASRRSHFR